ncbi:MAG TPA: hypothetical protein VFG14_00060, partial [Chthoniobacteraceae bacterium]|nr:hypothetical protein [Chthoniobacteraceae bacterium]
MGNVMGRVFLSASVPVIGRGDYFQTANPFLIQFAVRELLTVCLGRRTIVWGGHPAITPMVWAVCESLGVRYETSVKLFQSRIFEEDYPAENERFSNVTFVPAVENDELRSLARMRSEMFDGQFESAVFIGGMDGIFEEYKLFKERHPKARIVALR